MGLFTQRPQHNEEWAGLPSEPREPESPAERLIDPPAAADLLGAGGEVESIAIPLPPVQPPQAAGDPGTHGTPGEGV